MKHIFLCIAIAISSITAFGQYNNEIKIEKILETDTTSLGQKINYPQFNNDAVTLLKITIPPGTSTGWHKHTIPVFAYVLKGTLTVEFEGGKILTFDAGKSIAESININHIGRNNSSDNVELIAIYLGEKGEKLSTPIETK